MKRKNKAGEKKEKGIHYKKQISGAVINWCIARAVQFSVKVRKIGSIFKN